MKFKNVGNIDWAVKKCQLWKFLQRSALKLRKVNSVFLSRCHKSSAVIRTELQNWIFTTSCAIIFFNNFSPLLGVRLIRRTSFQNLPLFTETIQERFVINSGIDDDVRTVILKMLHLVWLKPGHSMKIISINILLQKFLVKSYLLNSPL